MHTLLQHFCEQLKASVWSAPAGCVVLAIVLSQFTLFLDDRYTQDASGWFFITNSQGMSDLLSTIATSSLSLAGLSFSSIMVTMTLASGQFGPRLLRNFMKDRTSGYTLGTLMGTYTYCLFIIRGPPVEEVDDKPFAPQISAFVATVLALLSLGIFIRFVQHTLLIIQAENVVADAHLGLLETIRNVFPNPDDGKVQERIHDPDDDEGWPIKSGRSGYVQAIDKMSLVQIASSESAKLYLWVRAGDFISSAETIVRVIEGEPEEKLTKETIQRIQQCIYVGRNRTSEQDYEYGIRQLVEVALRALSPGINDPYTAIDCIDYLGSGLQTIFERQLPQSVYRDAEDSIRVIWHVTDYEGLVCAAVDQIRQSARTNCAVSCHLLKMLKTTALVSDREDQRRALLRQATMVKRDTTPAMFNDHDKNAIETRYKAVVKACRLPDPEDTKSDVKSNKKTREATE
ncbi:predicted protein [Phaeodactylum tricornutum CCAP 1055/1]|uniref:DUF2254 domain-containing protein n=1 Tax=Phaeodactylum tricornutum (strain CCAP 1055/1) TaxID=556484 RepID=B7FWL5_PHATC|nr:predicted protein [Phaeodactylum tricornutum CCAP 1055/1]EEC49226.1 predicted protein [Phaeodactylum tricornutum CCAP 1055/1]|eukprot:XP_002179403.1 predicted protein [Phaeodactylum tricornutum CCAP 1055/1]